MKVIPSFFSIICFSVFFLLSRNADAAPGVFNIVDFGAVPDGKTLSTLAIQKTLDACNQAGGGVVRIPRGTFLTGTIYLRSDVEVVIEAGATLLGSTDMKDYTPRHLIVGNEVKNIALTGPGTIDGQGQNFWTFVDASAKEKLDRVKYAMVPQHYWKHLPQKPDKMIELFKCTNVKVSNITLQNSESWTLDLLACENVFIDSVRIRNPFHGPNTDGIDVCSSQNVQIKNCDIYTGDDAIVLKNRSAKVSYPHPCKNITVTHCKLVSPTNGFKIGTESFGDFENIVFKDSVIEAGDPNNPLSAESVKLISPIRYDNILGPESGITLASVDGANIRNVVIQNITMRGARAPIFIRLGHRGIHPSSKEKSPVGSLDGVIIQNVVAENASAPSSVTGLPGYLVKNVTISDLKVTNIGAGYTAYSALSVPEKEESYPSGLMWGAMPAHSLFLRHADGVTFRNVSFKNSRQDTRRAVIVEDVANLKLEKLSLDDMALSNPLILLHQVRSAEINGTIPSNTATWVTVSGESSANISLAPNNPQTAQQVFALADGASPTSSKVQSVR